VAKKLGIHRRMVREALADAVPEQRKKIERARPKLEPAMSFIDAILEEDVTAPRKQRHTAHRIYDRLRMEKPEIELAETTVRKYVREKKAPPSGGPHTYTFKQSSFCTGCPGIRRGRVPAFVRHFLTVSAASPVSASQ